MPAKKSTDSPPAESLPSFEQALESLEALVDEMEGDDLPLERMIVDYEKGVRLRDICEKRLAEAQAKVERIRDGGGETVALEDFDETSQGGAASASGTGGEKKHSAAPPASVTEESDGELF